MTDSDRSFVTGFAIVVVVVVGMVCVAFQVEYNMTKKMVAQGYIWMPAHWERSK